MFDVRNSPFSNFTWFVGTIESIEDPEGLDRVQVRCFGFHSDDRSAVATEDLPWAPVSHGSARMSSPMVLPGNMCMGFFLDGTEAQQPVVLCTWTGVPTQKDTTRGFSDPKGIYPKKLNEPDNSPLARGANSAPAQYSKSTRVKDVNTADGGKFSEPETAYAPKYPNNHVIHTEAGHVIEMDGTPGKERVHIYHKTGSFVEFHPDGSLVVRSLKHRYEVTFADLNMYVSGSLNVSAGKNINYAAGENITFAAGKSIKFIAGEDLTVSAKSDVKIVSGGDALLSAQGGAEVVSGGDASLQAGGSIKVNGEELDMGASGDVTISGSGTATLSGGALASVQASVVKAGVNTFVGSAGSGQGSSASPDSPESPVKVVVITAPAANTD